MHDPTLPSRLRLNGVHFQPSNQPMNGQFQSKEEFIQRWRENSKRQTRLLYVIAPIWLLLFLLACFTQDFFFPKPVALNANSILGLVLIPLVIVWPLPIIRFFGMRLTGRLGLNCRYCHSNLTLTPNAYQQVLNDGKCASCGNLLLGDENRNHD